MANTAREADTIVADAVGDDLPNPVVDGELEQQTNTDFLARDDDFPPRKSVKVFQIYHFLSSQPLKYYLVIVKYNMAINRKFPFFFPNYLWLWKCFYVDVRYQKDEPETAGKEEKKEWMENFKSTLIVSGVVIAIIGAIFAVAKKIKEAWIESIYSHYTWDFGIYLTVGFNVLRSRHIPCWTC